MLVPVYEEQEALRYANYNMTEWSGLHYEEKAFHVAHYRLHRLIELHGNDAVSEQTEREMRRSRRR